MAVSAIAGTILALVSCESEREQSLRAMVENICAADLDWSGSSFSSDSEWSKSLLRLQDAIAEVDSDPWTDELDSQDVITEAATQCPENFRGFLGYGIDAGDPLSGSPTDLPTEGLPSTPEPPDASVDVHLADRGITAEQVIELGRLADATGYGLSPDSPLSFQQAQDFAVVIVGLCDDVASGATTWQAQIEQDVADGAPRDDAVLMNNFLRNSFCPRL